MEPVGRVTRLAAGLVLALAACGASTPAAPIRAQPRAHPRVHFAAGELGPQRPAGENATKGDLKTFAYASTDGAALAAEVTAVLAPAGGGTVQYEGYELLSQAERLESLATSAAQRLKRVNPSDPALVRARKDGIYAYSLSAEFAALMANLARADQNDDLGALNTAANQALALEGRGEELAAYYSALITELEKWKRANPESAAEAMRKFGG